MSEAEESAPRGLHWVGEVELQELAVRVVWHEPCDITPDEIASLICTLKRNTDALRFARDACQLAVDWLAPDHSPNLDALTACRAAIEKAEAILGE